MTQAGYANTPFDDILDTLEEHGHDAEVTVGRISREVGDKSFGALLFLPAMLEITPIGGIPGVPTFLALVILLMAVQIAIGRDRLWLPGPIERKGVTGEALQGAVDTLRKPARWIDRTFHGRLQFFTTPPFDRMIAIVCAILCLSVPPLELLPFASTVPMGAIALLGLALLFDDGLLVLLGLGLALGTLGIAVYLLI